MPLRAVKRRRTPPSAREGFRAIGLVLRPRGLHGELKLKLLTDFLERFDVGATVYLNGEPPQDPSVAMRGRRRPHPTCRPR